METSVEEQLALPEQRRRLKLFALTGAMMVTAAVFFFRPAMYWPLPRAVLWLFVPAFGAVLGGLLWLGLLVNRFRRPSIPTEAEIASYWEGEWQRFEDLRDHTQSDRSVGIAYMRELRAAVAELEAIAAERPRLTGGWDAEAELTRFKDRLEAAERQLG